MVTKEQHDELARRIEAELQVEAFIVLLEQRYGIQSSDIPKYLDAIRWVIQHRARVSRVVWTVILGIVALSITGLLNALWEGIKHNAKG